MSTCIMSQDPHQNWYLHAADCNRKKSCNDDDITVATTDLEDTMLPISRLPAFIFLKTAIDRFPHVEAFKPIVRVPC